MFLSLGTNLGRRAANLYTAVDYLEQFLGKLRLSSIYETRPLYVTQQPPFLNVVAAGSTHLAPRQLLEQCLATEARMGRNRRRSVPKGPRVIDVDILLYGERVVREKDLWIPHPLMKERQFVLVPLLELEPELRDPESGKPYARVLAGLEEQGVYIFSPWDYTHST